MTDYTVTRAIAAVTLTFSIALFASDLRAAGSHQRGHGSLEIGMPGEPSEVGRTIEVVMADNYFEPEKVDVVSGETIRFLVRNEGKFVHEFNIGTPQMHAEHQVEMVMMVEHGALKADRIDRELMKMDMGNGQTMEHDDPNSVLLEPGQSAEVIWTFTNPMALEFACNVPGHYNAGMAGIISFVTKVSSR